MEIWCAQVKARPDLTQVRRRLKILSLKRDILGYPRPMYSKPPAGGARSQFFDPENLSQTVGSTQSVESPIADRNRGRINHGPERIQIGVPSPSVYKSDMLYNPNYVTEPGRATHRSCGRPGPGVFSCLYIIKLQ